MKGIAKFIFLMLVCSSPCFGQRSMSYTERSRGVKVVINNFYKSPPACGVLKTTSVYEAGVVDGLSVLQGTTILICVECKAESYPLVKGKHFILMLGEECLYSESMYNFTDLPAEILKIKKKYNILSLIEYSSE